MKRHLNTLYVSTEGAWISKEGENIVVSANKKTLGRMPIHMIGSLVCIGRMMVSPPLMGFCAQKGVSIVYLTDNGRFLARVEGPVSGNVLLRHAQYRRSDEGPEQIVQHIVAAKIHNQRNVLRRALRDHRDKLHNTPLIDDAVRHLGRLIEQAKHCDDVDSLRGFEGDAARQYFGVFAQLLHTTDALVFTGRSRRPPLDPVNAVLSFVYTLLTHDCRSALEAVGLDPAVGFLHRLRPGRPSLALDLVEEFRAPIADRLTLSLCNRRQLNAKHFTHYDNGAVTLTDAGRKTVITAWQEKKKQTLTHAFLDDTIHIGTLWHIQSMLLARTLRGDLDAYVPYLYK